MDPKAISTLPFRLLLRRVHLPTHFAAHRGWPSLQENHWLPRYKHSYETTIPIVTYLCPPGTTMGSKTTSSCEESPKTRGLFSGSIITLRTTDPARLPLPGFALVEMAWHLARVVSMSASGLIQDLDLRFEGDDDDLVEDKLLRQRVLDWIPSTETPISFAPSAADN